MEGVTTAYMGATAMYVLSFISRGAALGCGLALAAGPAAAAAPRVVTILGDSITAGLGLPAADALPAQLQKALAAQGLAVVVRAAGVSGDTSAGALARTDFSVQPDSAVCVVELGGNDFLQSLSPKATEDNLRGVIAKLQRRRIAVVLAGGRLPAHATGAYGREFAAIFPRVAKATHVILSADLLNGVLGDRNLRQADGLHPNAPGVRLLAARLAAPVALALKGSGDATRGAAPAQVRRRR